MLRLHIESDFAPEKVAYFLPAVIETGDEDAKFTAQFAGRYNLYDPLRRYMPHRKKS